MIESGKGGIALIPNSDSARKEHSEDGTCWTKKFSEEFPIDSIVREENKEIYTVKAPHAGYTIEVEAKSKGEECAAKVLTEKKVIIALLTMIDMEANGPCELRDSDGNLIYKGNFTKGYLQGRVKEYNQEGKLIFDGFYYKGNKQENITRCRLLKHYWEERDASHNIIRYCRKNKKGEYDGICYVYQNNTISEIGVYKAGVWIEQLKKFERNVMTEYQDGKKVYEGGYLNDLKRNFPRNGRGTEYENDGKTIVYDGLYKKGKRHGSGTFYEPGRRGRETSYMCGYRRKCCIISLVLLTILIIVIIILAIILSVRKKTANKESCSIAKDVQNFYVYSNRCNDAAILHFTPASDSTVRTIDIGDYAFSSVRDVKIDGLKKLKSLKIGKNSFTQKTNDYGNDESKSFHVLNCESLELIQIGEFSFSDFGGDFELKNLDSLQSLMIGIMGSESANFYYSSFIVQGLFFFAFLSV